MDISRSQLARLTAGKSVVCTALRWIPFFLPTLAIAFASSTAELTTILGIGEMAALVTLLAGRHLDAGLERRIMIGALGLVALSSLLALVGTITSFAAAFLMLVIGVSLYTVGGHTYLSRRVAFDRRGQVIGLFETSWASALLIGAPLIAVLINIVGWRGPFVALAVLSILMAIVVARTPDTATVSVDATAPVVKQPLTAAAWRVIFASAATGVAGLTTIVIAGTWLDDQLGVSTGGVGLVAMAFGAAELLSSISSAVFADRVGKVRSTRAMLFLVLVGLAIMTQAGTSLVIGVVGLLCFFLGFEFAMVTSFGIISEAMPHARGRALAAGNAVGTMTRGASTIASGRLYDEFGINGPITLSVIGAVAGIALLTAHQRSAAGRHMVAKEQRDFSGG